MRKTKKQYYSNGEVNKVADDNKNFWKTDEFLFQQVKQIQTITLIESNMVISDDQKIANVFIECFDTIVPNTIVPK